MVSDLQRLQRQLRYQFNHLPYLKQALTHRSAGILNNERLEFLGDSILSFIMAKALYEKFPDMSEGQLSRLRAHLVKGEMIAQVALEIGLGDYLSLGPGELKSGGFRRTSILADALEAVIAAVLLDGGIAACETLIRQLYQTRLEDSQLNDNLKDHKTQLQEYLQSQKKPLPEYKLVKTEGEEHEQLFYVTCHVHGFDLITEGQGDSRRKAEQNAAKTYLEKMGSGSN